MALSNRVAGLEKPSRFEVQSTENFWEEHCPVVGEEAYLFDKEDLVNLARPGDVAWLDEFLIKILVRFSCAPLRVRTFPLVSVVERLTNISEVDLFAAGVSLGNSEGPSPILTFR